MHNPTTTESPFGELAGSPELEGGSAAQFENGLYDRAEVSLNLAAPAAPEIEDNAPIFDLTAEPMSDEQEPPSVTADEDAATAPAGVAESSVNTPQEVTGLELTIDPKFEALCPRLPEQEGEYLREGLKKDGQINPVIFWEHKGKNIIVDGHNRYRMLKELGVQDVKTLAMNFKDREAAVNWIITHQLGRRNLPPLAASYFRGLIFLEKKGTHGGDRKSKVKDEPLIDTATDVAKKTGVSRSKIKCDANFAKAVQELGIEADVLSGAEKRSPSQIIKAAFPSNMKEVPAAEIASDTDADAGDDPYMTSATYKNVQGIIRAIRRIPWMDLDPEIKDRARADIEGALPPPDFHKIDAAAARAKAKKTMAARKKSSKKTATEEQVELPFMDLPAVEESAAMPAANEKEIVPQL